MKDISTALALHYAQTTTSIANCWKVTLTNGSVLCFTDHDEPLTVDGLVYLARGGYTMSDVASASNLDVDNMEVLGFLDSVAITEDDLRAGIWDYAEVRLFQVNWADTSQGILRMRLGHIGEVSEEKGKFKAELLGLMYALQNSFIEVTSAACRADFGDSRCKISLTGSPGGYSIVGVVDSYLDSTLTILDASNGQVAAYFTGGKLTFTSGANSGLSFDIKSSVPGSITLQLPPPYTVAPLTSYLATAGCDKSIETCRDRFNNVVNFRGEPFLPGNDKAIQVGRK